MRLVKIAAFALMLSCVARAMDVVDIIEDEVAPLATPTDVEARFVIAFDAGQNVTAAHVFDFKPPCAEEDRSKCPPLVEHHQVLPGGLHDLHEHKTLDNLRGVVHKLMGFVDQHVPQVTHQKMPLFLLGTEGFRQVQSTDQKALLSVIQSVLESEEHAERFEVEGCSILSPTQEGPLGWISVNYHAGVVDENIDIASGKKTVTHIDLNDNWLQFTRIMPLFPVEGIAEPPESEIWYLKNHIDGTTKMRLYTKNTDKRGMLKARDYIMRKTTADGAVPTQESVAEVALKLMRMEQYCDEGTQMCGIDGSFQPPLNKTETVVATGHFHTLAARIADFDGSFESVKSEADISTAKQSFTVGKFCEDSKAVCEKNAGSSICAELAFACVSMRTGFRMSDKQRIQAVKKVRGFEVSWVFGSVLLHRQGRFDELLDGADRHHREHVPGHYEEQFFEEKPMLEHKSDLKPLTDDEFDVKRPFKAAPEIKKRELKGFFSDGKRRRRLDEL